MPRWLDRLLRRRTEPATSPPPAEPLAASAPSVEAESARAADEGDARERQAVAVEAREARERETCPTCGGTGVFAGPPGHRYCMRCALRSEQI